MDVREALNSLLAAPLFSRFEAALRHNSIFDVLAVGTREVSHAAFLCWLLNPQEGHGAGDHPLRTFLTQAAAKGMQAGDAITPLDIDLLSLHSATSQCEVAVTGKVNGRDTAGRLDILVTLPGPDGTTQPVLIVEHKVYAEQSGQQTEVYKAWAANHKLNQPELNGARQPLLVYVCPDISLQLLPPAEPFVAFEYTDLAEWLNDLLAYPGVSERADFLIREYQACLTRQDLFVNDAAQRCQDLLEEDARCSQALKVLRSNPTELRRFDGHLNRHPKAFEKLRIKQTRVASRGDAATVVRLRELAEPVFTGSDWGVQGGTGSFTAYHKPVGRKIREAFDEAELDGLGRPYLQFYFTRPEMNAGVLDLYGGVVGGQGDARKPMQAWVRDFCRVLRERVPSNLRSKVTRGNSIAKIPLAFRGIEETADDTPERVNQHESELRKCVSAIETLKALVEQWGADDLQRSIQTSFQGVRKK